MILRAALTLSLAGVILAAVRLVRGPSAADRAVALDTMTLISVSTIAMIALNAGRLIYLDAAVVYAVLSFVGVVAVARHLEGGS
jgi:multicomponent Na+:H+ antiporter subunit F